MAAERSISGVNPLDGQRRSRRDFLLRDLPAFASLVFAACSRGSSPSPTTLEPPQPSVVPPTPTTDALPPPTTEPTAEKLPSEVLDLTNWKLTLPDGPPEHPIEVEQPELDGYKNKSWFVVTPDGEGVRFRAPVTGVTTEGSDYPRSELREMANNGRGEASWSSTEGTHRMFLDQVITAVPHTKQHIVAGQVHDEEDDVIVIRLEGEEGEGAELFIDVDGDNMYTLDPNYILGTRFKVKFVVEDEETKVYYNDSENPVYTLKKDYSGGYFKAGAYPQSNCNTEVDPSLCNDNNFGEVIIYQLDVTHQ